jgi:hypothetical protein
MSGGVVINPKVGETKTEPIGQLEKEKLAKGKGVYTEAPNSTTQFLETHFKPEMPYPLSLKDPNGYETINFVQPLPNTIPFISSEFWRVWLKTLNLALLGGTPSNSIPLFIFHFVVIFNLSLSF